MRRILVSAISGDVANGILKILKETDSVVFGCDINEYPIGMDKVSAYWKSDLAISSFYITNILEKCREYHITHFIPVNEQEIRVVNHNKKVFLDVGIKVMINAPFIIDTFLDKYRTYEHLKNLEGICVPETFRYSDFVEDGTEYVVKLNQSCGSKLFEVVRSRREIEKLGLKEEEFVIQKYLKNAEEEYTVGVFSNGEKIETIIFKRKLTHGYTSFVELVRDEKIEYEARQIAQCMELKGYINIQLRKNNGNNYIFEINPRISGTVYFRHMLEFKDVLWWLDLLDCNNDFEYKHPYKEAIGMRELSEKFVILR